MMIWSPTVMLLLIGLVRLDCILIGAAAVLGLQTFYFRMDRASPMDPWRAALRACIGGVGAIVFGVLLTVGVVTRLFGLWGDTAAGDTNSWMFVFAAVLLLTIWTNLVLQVDWQWADAGRGALLASSVFASAMSEAGWALAPCAFAVVAGIAVARSGWHLARDTSSEFMAMQGPGNPG